MNTENDLVLIKNRDRSETVMVRKEKQDEYQNFHQVVPGSYVDMNGNPVPDPEPAGPVYPVDISDEETEAYTKGILEAYFQYYEKYGNHRTARRKLGKKIKMDPKVIRQIVLLNT